MTNPVKEPLVHFLLLSSLLFLGFELVSSREDPALDEIIVSEGRIHSLVLGFEKVWRRPPSAEERDGLIDNFVKEEIMYREAVAMGLDQDDAVVRRRLRQKLEFLSEDLVKLEPTDDELQLFLDENSPMFRQETRFSFRQLYFNANKRGTRVETDIQQFLNNLESSVDDAEIIADRIMIPSSFEKIGERDVIRVLGSQFLDGLRSTPINQWYGPVASGFGLHLVYVRNRIDGVVPPLSEIRRLVAREWTTVARKQSNDSFYNALRQRYRVIIATSKSGVSSQLATVAN